MIMAVLGNARCCSHARKVIYQSATTRICCLLRYECDNSTSDDAHQLRHKLTNPLPGADGNDVIAIQGGAEYDATTCRRHTAHRHGEGNEALRTAKLKSPTHTSVSSSSLVKSGPMNLYAQSVLSEQQCGH